MPGSSTGCAQPVSSATRPRVAPRGAWRPGCETGDAAGTDDGASLSIAASGFSAGTRSRTGPAKGRPSSPASRRAARKRSG